MSSSGWTGAESQRRVILNWLFEITLDYKLHLETVFYAQKYLDRYMTITEWIKYQGCKDLQLIGAACLLTASKYNDYDPVQIDKLVHHGDGSFTKEDLMGKELEVLISLNHRLECSTELLIINTLKDVLVYGMGIKVCNEVLVLAQFLCCAGMVHHGDGSFTKEDLMGKELEVLISLNHRLECSTELLIINTLKDVLVYGMGIKVCNEVLVLAQFLCCAGIMIPETIQIHPLFLGTEAFIMALSAQGLVRIIPFILRYTGIAPGVLEGPKQELLKGWNQMIDHPHNLFIARYCTKSGSNLLYGLFI
jgi:hypothetical protein